MLSYGQLASLYVLHFEYNVVSLSLIIVGQGIASAAFAALGVHRTYFAVELGRLQPKWITAFPYGVVPHPMISGAVVALTGVWMMPGVRLNYPWLVPAHITFYLLHMLQEQFDFHRHR